MERNCTNILMSLRIVQSRKDKIKSRSIRIVAKQHTGRKIQLCQISSKLLNEIGMLLRRVKDINTQIRFIEREHGELNTIIPFGIQQIICHGFINLLLFPAIQTISNDTTLTGITCRTSVNGPCRRKPTA